MNVSFPWKSPIKKFIFSNAAGLQSPNLLIMNYFEGVFQEFWPHIMEEILYRTYILQNSHFWAREPLATCGTFPFFNFVSIWLPILHARIQSLKESRVVTMESISIEHIELISHLKIPEELHFFNKETPIFPNFLKVVSILFYFKDFMVIMPSCFYKDNKGNLRRSRSFQEHHKHKNFTYIPLTYVKFQKLEINL